MNPKSDRSISFGGKRAVITFLLIMGITILLLIIVRSMLP